MKHNVLLIDPTINERGVALLKENCNVYMAPDGKEDTLISYINQYKIEGVVSRVELLTRKIFESCPTLKVVSTNGVGFDQVDMDAANEYGVQICNIPDGNYTSVAEHAMMFVLACARDLVFADKYVRTGSWNTRSTVMPQDVAGKTLLLVGFGRIGKRVAQLALPFDIRVMAYDVYVSADKMAVLGVEKAETLEDGLRQADFVTIHLPLTPETTGMIKAEQLRVMKKTAYLCNMGRGTMVDEAALYEALATKQIAGAALDVFDPEPPCSDNPLFKLDNVIVTAHIAGITQEAYERCAIKAAENIIKTLNGKDSGHCINKDAIEKR